MMRETQRLNKIERRQKSRQEPSLISQVIYPEWHLELMMQMAPCSPQ